MNLAPVALVKIGGSLLASADLPKRLGGWLAKAMAAKPDWHFVLVAGGGKLVDAVREIDARTPLGDELAHWLCVDLMDVTARLVGCMLPELKVVDDFAVLEHRLWEPGATVLLPGQFLRQVEPNRVGTRLASDWSVTSDAIAGRLAVVLIARELVLIKSASPPPIDGGERWEQLAAAGYVDRFLPKLAAELPEARCVVLNNDSVAKVE